MEINQIIQPAIILLSMGLLLGILLGIADKFLKVKEDERLEKLITMLPGYNCGACGHPGCSGLANAIFEGNGKLKDCKPLKAEKREEIINYLASAQGPDGSTIKIS